MVSDQDCKVDILIVFNPEALKEASESDKALEWCKTSLLLEAVNYTFQTPLGVFLYYARIARGLHFEKKKQL
jgi:hypothetical protein